MSTEDPISHACRLLREAAKGLQQAHTCGDRDDWTGEPEAKAAFDEYMAVAGALEAAAAQEPVATVFTMESLTPGGGVKYHATIHEPLPAGTKLYTHPQPADPAQRPANCGSGFCSCLECPHEDTAPLLIRLRTLEVDHDPDGWPAIRMRDVTALLDMIDLLREDKTRIDWLADPANTIGNVQLPIHCVHANLHSLRAAIDMAREITP